MLRRLPTRSAFTFCALFAFFLTARPANGQVPTGTISGRVNDTTGQPVVGATVTLESQSIQGIPKTQTAPGGDYLFKSLPPGRYSVVFTLPAFAKVVQVVDVAALEMVTVNVALKPTVAETVTVASETGAFLGTIDNSTNIKQRLLTSLPTTRTMLAAVALAPQAHATGPDGAMSLAGAMSYENIFLLNGVRIQDNLRGTPLSLFIEDAIQETTVSSSAVSAEYGGFAGGMVNTLTKSGGNAVSGSFRTTLTNDNWRTVSPFGEPKINKTVPTYEYTVGGPVVRDRLWFFTAGRQSDQKLARQTGYTNTPYEYRNDQTRMEAKLTQSLSPTQRLSVAFTGIREKETNSAYPSSSLVMDTASLTTRELPQNLVAVNYAGTFGSRLFIEAQYSSRSFTFEHDGGLHTDRVRGTPLIDQNTGAHWWAANFCGVCVNESRNNNAVVMKGTYFVPSTTLGSHSLAFGYDRYNDKLKADNHQSASGYQVYTTGSFIDGGVVYPAIEPESTVIAYWPLALSSQGTNYRTHALFLNDSWKLNGQLSANLGVRYDKNSGKDAAGTLVAKDSAWSPRLGLAWDPTGKGKTTFSASMGRYVTGIANSIASTGTGAGTPSILVYPYLGPGINDGTSSLVASDEALRRVFNWYDAAQPDPVYVDIPGVGRRINGSLESPYSDYYSVGVGQELGRHGSIRVDFVRRSYGNFYATRTDQTTGTVEDAFGQVIDVKLIENTNDLKREYRALEVQGRYRVGSTLDVGGSYALSKLSGNVDGETSGSGPIASSIFSYPEYSEARWAYPEGALSADQRHRARIWATYSVPGTRGVGDVQLGAIQSLQSGTPYGAVGAIDTTRYVQGTSYALPPESVSYFFTARDAFHTEALVKTDFVLNYTRRLGRGSEVFAQFYVFNLFNQFQLHYEPGDDINTTVLTRYDTSQYKRFNPFTETPVQGVNWDYGSKFGQAVGKGAYTAPRTYRVSAGLRF
jgi:hypothetical protein